MRSFPHFQCQPPGWTCHQPRLSPAVTVAVAVTGFRKGKNCCATAAGREEWECVRGAPCRKAGGPGGAPGAPAEVPHGEAAAVPCRPGGPWGAGSSCSPGRSPHQSRGCSKEPLTPWEDCAGRSYVPVERKAHTGAGLLPGPVSSWGTHTGAGCTCLEDGPTKGTWSGRIPEALQPVRITGVEKVHEGLAPAGGTPGWGRRGKLRGMNSLLWQIPWAVPFSDSSFV